jgi:AcrR family transcriptional regulator
VLRGTKRSARRSLHEVRSEETRTRLLEATLESLVAVGYARTSTTEIAERAGVSRGAQVYHYPTKAALVAAAVGWLLERRHDELRQICAKQPRNGNGLAMAIDLLWRIFEGPTFPAWLELVVAARTDQDLRARVARLSDRFAETLGATLRERHPAIARSPLFRRPDLALALMDGIALTRILYEDEARCSRMVRTLREIAQRAHWGSKRRPKPTESIAGEEPVIDRHAVRVTERRPFDPREPVNV